MRDFQPGCLASFSSPEACRVAFGLRIRNVGFNDSPHAEAVCRLSVPLMDTLMCPWIIPFKDFTRYGIAQRQILRYRALDPAIWLKDSRTVYSHQDLKISQDRKTIVFRLEESKAAYVSGVPELSRKLLGSLIQNFRDCNIIVLCRYSDQLESFRREFGDRAIIMDRVIDGAALLQLSDLFIGSGGTMNCEAALLEVPNMAYAMHNILVNKFLFGKGVSHRCRDTDSMVRLGRKMLHDQRMRKDIASRSRKLLAAMEDPMKQIVRVLESDRG